VGEYPLCHCTRCGKQKDFPIGTVLDPLWRMGRFGRLRFLVRWSAPWVGLVVLIGLALAAVVALLALAAGRHGAHEVKAIVIALFVEGGLCVVAAVLFDPMGYGRKTGRDVARAAMASPQRASMRAMNPVLDQPEKIGRVRRFDDVLYAGGVVLIGIAVLFHYVA
jgi:hypothetical protein